MSWDDEEVASLLRGLADDLMEADGATRNGYFIELHRLADNLFRLALEAHPDAPPEVAARAFDVSDPLPAPQVVRELNRLGSPLLDREIRALYRQVNAARNDLVHDLAMRRKVISMGSSRRNADLALRLAQQLDPRDEPPRRKRRPSPVAATPAPRLLPIAAALLLGLLVGIALGAFLF